MAMLCRAGLTEAAPLQDVVEIGRFITKGRPSKRFDCFLEEKYFS